MHFNRNNNLKSVKKVAKNNAIIYISVYIRMYIYEVFYFTNAPLNYL